MERMQRDLIADLVVDATRSSGEHAVKNIEQLTISLWRSMAWYPDDK
jgi:hypothetical protein